MKILFDHQAYDFLNFGGIPRYFYELTKGLNILGHNVTNTIRYSENIYTKDRDVFNANPFLGGANIKGRRTLKKYLNKKVSINYVRKDNYDIFHPTYYDSYFLQYIKKKPYVVTFHDLIHERFSDRYDFLAKDHKTIFFKKEILKKAAKIISVSETTKRDLIDIYNVDPDKIQVIGLGNSININDIKYYHHINRDYILFVGNRKAYKNFGFCIEALSSILKKNNLLFVCAGGGAFDRSENEMIKNLGLSNHVKHEEITDSSIASLYGNAYAFIFPSLYEGFGIPVLEAFACGCPCLLSNGGSLPEVGGEAALYFDPTDVSSIQQSLNIILANSTLRSSLIAKGRLRENLFSWGITCSKTSLLYQSVIDEFN